jgi:hypothetical protein
MSSLLRSYFISTLMLGTVWTSGAHGRDLFRLSQELRLDVAHSSTTFATALGDLNGDGWLDILEGNGFGGPNLVWLNDGKGQFVDSGLRLDNPGTTRNATLADIDGDDQLDAVISGLSLDWPNPGHYDGALVLKNEQMKFTSLGPPVAIAQSVAAATGDLDGNGTIDLFVGGWEAVVGIGQAEDSRVWLNDGSGNFTKVESAVGSEQVLGVHGVALADLDGDSDLDAYLATWWPGLPDEIWLNDGHGTFSDSGLRLGGNDISYSVALTDVSGDGRPDVISAGASGAQVYLSDGMGEFVPTSQALAQGLGIARMATGDFNGDGHADILAGVSKAPSQVWINNGHGYFTDSGMRMTTTGGESLGLGDLNGDGWLDFVQGTQDATPTTVWFGLDPKDLNFDGVVDAGDLADLTNNLGGDPSKFDLDYDGRVTQSDISFYLRVLLHATPGDADLDGSVDLNDFGILKANFAQIGKGWADGDFNGNTVPDLEDFGLLKQNFGKGTAGGAAAVPEPAGWVIFIAGIATSALIRLRRANVSAADIN